MKYLGGILIGVILFTLACKKDVEPDPLTPLEQFNIDLELIDNWLAENGIADTLIEPISQIRYTINVKSTRGISPTDVNDSIRVDYEGRFLESQEVFDSNTSFDILLGSTIPGWQIMLREMIEGDEFTIYLPSIYAYGPSGRGSIPPNAVLVFDIKLIRVK